MKNELENIIQNRLLQLGSSGISVQIAGDEAVSILEAIYQKGRDDSERDLRASIARQQAEEFITKAEAMKLLGKSENTLWKWNRKGYLTWVKRGGTIMYSRVSVQEILSGKSRDSMENEKDKDILEISDESVIIYRSWFECLKEQGPKRFAQAMIALLSFAFYNADVKSFSLPRQLEAILETFTPVIETNRKKRRGGSKGADFGKKGGRPPQNADLKTPEGLSDGTLMGADEESPKAPPYNVNGNEKVNVNENVSVNVTDGNASSPHTDFEFYIPVFFFRNARHPEKQAKKFVEHYAPSNWKLTGGELMATDQQRIALAQRWDIRDDSCDRFKPDDLAMWKELYKIAPLKIQTLMISPSVQLQRRDDNAIIFGPREISEWIEANLPTTEPIVRKWFQERKLSYVYV